MTVALRRRTWRSGPRSADQTVCVPVTKKVPVQVCVPTTVMENYTVQVCSLEEQKEAYKVQVCEYKQEIHKHMITVTSYKTVCRGSDGKRARHDLRAGAAARRCATTPCCYTVLLLRPLTAAEAVT